MLNFSLTRTCQASTDLIYKRRQPIWHIGVCICKEGSHAWQTGYQISSSTMGKIACHTVRDRLMGHLRVNVPRARIYWPSQLLVCVKLRTNVLSCCVNSGMAENASWSGLGGNFLTWATNLEMPRNGPPGHLLDNYLHKSYDFVKMCFHMLVEASQIFSRF